MHTRFAAVEAVVRAFPRLQDEPFKIAKVVVDNSVYFSGKRWMLVLIGAGVTWMTRLTWVTGMNRMSGVAWIRF